MVKVSGYVAKPETARKKGAHQYFFVNGRYMRHPYFHKAVMDAYEQLIPAGEQISYFIYFEVDPANIDVNIHPTKQRSNLKRAGYLADSFCFDQGVIGQVQCCPFYRFRHGGHARYSCF